MQGNRHSSRAFQQRGQKLQIIHSPRLCRIWELCKRRKSINHLLSRIYPVLSKAPARGRGLGLQFLRHIERSRLLLFLLDGTATEPHPREAFKTLLRELENFNPTLLMKPRIIAITKSDAMDADTLQSFKRMKIDKQKPLVISAVSGDNIDVLIRTLWDAISVK